jgi:hypothetical protein
MLKIQRSGRLCAIAANGQLSLIGGNMMKDLSLSRTMVQRYGSGILN